MQIPSICSPPRFLYQQQSQQHQLQLLTTCWHLCRLAPHNHRPKSVNVSIECFNLMRKRNIIVLLTDEVAVEALSNTIPNVATESVPMDTKEISLEFYQTSNCDANIHQTIQIFCLPTSLQLLQLLLQPLRFLWCLCS
jgi:hypothetical protein